MNGTCMYKYAHAHFSMHVHVHVYTCLCFQANPDTAGQSNSGGLHEVEGINILQIHQHFTG